MKPNPHDNDPPFEHLRNIGSPKAKDRRKTTIYANSRLVSCRINSRKIKSRSNGAIYANPPRAGTWHGFGHLERTLPASSISRKRSHASLCISSHPQGTWQIPAPRIGSAWAVLSAANHPSYDIQPAGFSDSQSLGAGGPIEDAGSVRSRCPKPCQVPALGGFA